MKILVTGATGYIGGRLIPRLLDQGYHVRAMGRSLEKLQGRYWSNHPNVDLVQGDVLDFPSLEKELEGCDVAYYLVHSMVREQKDFVTADREGALNFVAAAEHAQLKRIIYLGGLGREEEHLSRHLQSRKEVGEIFRRGAIPATIFRAAMIIGAGSASFEILRYLVDRVPLMVTPKWVRTPVQPISIVNVLEYLVQVLNVPETIGQTFDIGGEEVTTYQKLMDIYAEEAKLHKRLVIPVGVLTPKLSSYWIGLVTPLPPSIGRPLAEGLSNEVICQDTRIQTLIPQKLLSYREAIRRSLDKIAQNTIETAWSDAGKIPPADWIDTQDPEWAGGTLLQSRHTTEIKAPLQDVWKTVERIGGKKGNFSTSWLWKLRGTIDKGVGGVGLRRGRRDTEHLQVGDAVDFWRVKRIRPPHRLTLVAEMKLPGEALIEFHLSETKEGKTHLVQTARFFPFGLWGILYWYILTPFHGWIFNQMLYEIKKETLSQLEGAGGS